MSDDTDPLTEPPADAGNAFHGPDWHDTSKATSESTSGAAVPRRGRRVRITRRRKQKLRRRRGVGIAMVVAG